MEHAHLAREFALFAERECSGRGPLYERLSHAIAGDPDLLELAGQACSTPVANLFFAAVHRLLFDRPEHPLAAIYAGGERDPLPAFRAFCLEHRAALTGLLRSRRVQTNEVRRAACLLPAFGVVAADGPGKALALIEIGTSAGLLLNFDRYAYD